MISENIAILLITRCQSERVYACIQSVANTLSLDSRQKVKFYVKYTGKNASDILKLDQTIANLGIAHIIVQGTYNFARCTNELAALGNEKYILCMNDDIELIDDCISHCFDILHANSAFGTVGVKLLFEDNTIQHAGHMLLLRNDDFCQITHYLLRQPNQQLPDYVSVGNTFAFCMFRRSDFDACNGLNETYKKCFEDVEFNWKLLAKGKLHVTAGSVSAFHYESTTRKKQDCLIERDDVDQLIAFFRHNKDNILQNEKNLERTILRV